MNDKKEDIFLGYGVEVILPDEESFLKIRETLQRIGIPSYKEDKTLYQSCHILHKRGRYAIIHFLELFRLDGRTSNFSKEDKARRDIITQMLEDWGLLKIVETEKKRLAEEKHERVRVKVIPFKEKGEWQCVAKYMIGGRKNV
jgi:hypothetical protein